MYDITIEGSLMGYENDFLDFYHLINSQISYTKNNKISTVRSQRNLCKTKILYIRLESLFIKNKNRRSIHFRVQSTFIRRKSWSFKSYTIQIKLHSKIFAFENANLF